MYSLIAIIGAVCSGTSWLISKSMIEKQYNPKTYSLILIVFASIFLSPALFLYIPQFKREDIFGLTILIIIAVCYAASNILNFRGLRTVELSKYTLIRPLQILITVIGGTIIFSERFDANRQFGVILILLALFLIFYKKGQLGKYNDGSLYIITACIVTGIAAMLNKFVSGFALPVFFIVFANYFFQIPFLLTKETFKEAQSILQKHWKRALIAGILAPLAWSCYIIALKNSNISLIDPITQSVTIVTQIILGIIVLKERTDLNKKFAGFLLVAVGVTLLNM